MELRSGTRMCPITRPSGGRGRPMMYSFCSMYSLRRGGGEAQSLLFFGHEKEGQGELMSRFCAFFRVGWREESPYLRPGVEGGKELAGGLSRIH